jgi:hypothetical protein
MPNTPTQVAVVTAAYAKWQTRLNQFSEKTPGITKADVDSARKAMETAIREWEKPGPGEDTKSAKIDRKPKRKSWWPKFK